MSRYVLSAFLALCMCFSAIGQELQVTGSRKAVRTSELRAMYWFLSHQWLAWLLYWLCRTGKD